MQGQPNGPGAGDLPPPGTATYETQRLVLLELVVDAPPNGDPIERIGRVLDRSSTDIEVAIRALALVGLATQRDGQAFATPAARYFEHLWPVRL